MKYLIFFLALMISYQLSAQTKLIAYKSHAGDLDFFIPDAQADDDYGLPPQRIIKIERLNDSTIVETTDHYAGEVVTDTVVNHPYFSNTKLSLDDIKARYYRSDIKFEGFNKKTAKEKRKEKRAKKRKKKMKEEKITPPNILKKNEKERITPKCSPKTDSSKAQLPERAAVGFIGSQEPPHSGPFSSSSSSLALVGFLCILYFLSLGYLVYKRQRRSLQKA